MRTMLLGIVLSVSLSAYAQDGALEVLRRDLKTQKVAIMTESLPLTEAQSEKFWPIYREYDHELSELGDRRLVVIKKYAENFDKLDDVLAKELVDDSFRIANDRNELLEKYYKKVSTAIGVIPASRFVQIENQLLTLIDAQIASEIPLVKLSKGAGEAPGE